MKLVEYFTWVCIYMISQVYAKVGNYSLVHSPLACFFAVTRSHCDSHFHLAETKFCQAMHMYLFWVTIFLPHYCPFPYGPMQLMVTFLELYCSHLSHEGTPRSDYVGIHGVGLARDEKQVAWVVVGLQTQGEIVNVTMLLTHSAWVSGSICWPLGMWCSHVQPCFPTDYSSKDLVWEYRHQLLILQPAGSIWKTLCWDT